MSLIEALFNHEFTISRRDRIADGQGGWQIVYAVIGSARGRIRPATSAEREAAAMEERQISHVLYVASGTDVARGDVVEGARLMVDVLGVREPSRAGHHLEVDCLERQQEVSVEGY